MYTTCASCGATIQDNVDLCPFCGKPVISTTASKSEKLNWDYCGILAIRTPMKRTFSGKMEYECYFRAEAMGKDGPYTIASSDKYTLVQPFPIEPNPMGINEVDHQKANDSLTGLLEKLKNDSWEILPQVGPETWTYKFRKTAS